MIVSPVQRAVDSWTTVVHRVWTTISSTGRPCGCPPAAHRSRAVVPSVTALLHIPVHCSATRRALSPSRVKGVTPRCRIGLWGTGVKLGTVLGRTTPHLCIRCAQLSPVHREPGLSTVSAHRVSGQKTASELRKQGYPLYPQPLLLLPTRVTGKSASKWVLCTTRRGRLRSRRARLDHDRHLLSVGCVRLVPGVLPLPGPDDTETTADEPVAGPTAGRPLTGRERPATAGGGLT